MKKEELLKKFEKVRKEYCSLRNQLDKIKDKKIIKNNKKRIGKCFKFRNSYNREDTWWLYLKVIGIDGTYLVIEEFQKTCYGVIEIKKSDTFHSSLLTESWGYIEIPNDEFEREKMKIIKEIEILSDLNEK